MRYPHKTAAVAAVLLTAALLASCAGNGVDTAVSPAGTSPAAASSGAGASGSPVSVAPPDSAAISAASASPSYTDAVHDDASLLLGRHGWSTAKLLSSFITILPESLVTNVEDSPMQFYWMRADVLSGDIGLDIKPYLGQSVTLKVYEVTGALPAKYTHPAMAYTRGIVVRNGDGAIVGAYIDTGRHAGVSYSLSGHDVKDIAGLTLEAYWEKNYFDPDDPVNKAAAGRTADEVITRYFEGMASGDTAKELSALTVGMKLDSLFSNMDNTLPFNLDPELYHYLMDVKILSIEEIRTEMPEGVTMYNVGIDAKLTDEARLILGHDGKMGRFVSVGEENGILRVFGDGTGP
jgi:hypothetical protein